MTLNWNFNEISDQMYMLIQDNVRNSVVHHVGQ